MVKIGKIIVFNILSLLTMMNIFYVFFYAGMYPPRLSGEFIMTIWEGGLLILLVWLMTLLINLNFIVTRAVTKKNLLRIPFFVFLITFLVSLVYFAMDWWNLGFNLAKFTNVILYLILVILTFMMLSDLRRVINEIFQR